MTPCPHCRDRIEELEETVRQLRAIVSGEQEPALTNIVHLTKREVQLFGLLMARTILTKDAYLTMREADDWDGDPKLLDVMICKMRKKLEPFGVVIETVWGKGYLFSPATKDKVRELSAAPRTVAPVGRYHPGVSLQQYADARVAVLAALRDAPNGLTWYGLRRSLNISNTRLHQVIPTLINEGAATREFSRVGNDFVYVVAA